MSDGLRPAHDALMPLHIELGPEGTIIHAGPTLRNWWLRGKRPPSCRRLMGTIANCSNSNRPTWFL